MTGAAMCPADTTEQEGDLGRLRPLPTWGSCLPRPPHPQRRGREQILL